MSLRYTTYMLVLAAGLEVACRPDPSTLPSCGCGAGRQARRIGAAGRPSSTSGSPGGVPRLLFFGVGFRHSDRRCEPPV